MEVNKDVDISPKNTRGFWIMESFIFVFKLILIRWLIIPIKYNLIFSLILIFAFLLPGKSDPYCEVSMGTQEHKTKVISGTLNPKWNDSMQFVIRDVQQDVLCITVFDRDLFSPNGKFAYNAFYKVYRPNKKLSCLRDLEYASCIL